ncbi:elongation factor G [Fimbriiglobus ruber]|uniref:Elongation factor G n=1 Tax=Fimbriiglobus ruber TaxID=1908690 RepID=A0A225DYV1_9BACT|nr:elongation factor G [Fimbriiglobus ruber]OWK46502.1 Translation elongation factor G-related protein [Fimbriiglobus ruber]
MSRHLVENVRDIALVGHRAAGKTSLADALLYEAHAVELLGSVDAGTSVADTDEDEQKHHFSIDTHVLHAEHGGKYLHILDAPGTPDFIGAALEALTAVETAVIVVSAASGIEANTRRMFKEATDRGLSRVVVINKLDADNVDLPGLIAAIRESFGPQCVPFNVPNRLGAGFSEVVCVLNQAAAVPRGYPIDPRAVRAQLIDAVVEADETLTEKFLTDGAVSSAELEAAIPKALAAGTLVPIFCMSAKKDKGVRELLDALSRYGLSPGYAKRRLAGMTVGSNGSAKPVEPTEASEFLGQVFKVVNDRYVGHLSFVRVLAGRLTPNHQIYDINTGKSVRIGHLLEVQGKTHVQVPEAGPGDIVAVAKVDGLHVGDTIAYRPDATMLPAIPFPTPMFGLAIGPKNRGDETKIAAGLHKIAEEDPTLKIAHDPQTHELVISGVGQLHLDVVQERLKHRFDVDVVATEPKIPFHETVTTKGGADHRHKKQTGGRGQFAEVHLRVYPLDRDIKSKEDLEERFANKANFEKLRAVHYDPALNFAFIDHVVGGTIPNQYLPAVEKGCREVMERGALAGYRMQDIAVEVFFGKEHPVDSSEAAFKTAGRIAFKKAILTARPVLLEPVVKLEITVPGKYTGAILGDLPTKRAQVENQDSLPGDLNVISARAPLSEVARYAAHLGGLTQGQGSFSMELSHYDPVPATLQASVVAKAGSQKDEDE